MSEGRGIDIEVAAPRSWAGVGAFKDQARLAAALEAEFGVALPATGSFVQAKGVTFSCLAPARFLASAERDAGLPARLAKSLDGIAAVTDQSDTWAIFSLSGALVREHLARVVPIDLGPDRLRVGDLALTRAGHMDVRLWRVAAQVYEIAAARSYARDLRSALE